MKKKFIDEQIWLLVFGGAFQRAYIYKPNISEYEKKTFKTALIVFIENLSLDYKTGKIEDPIHLENITAISNFTIKFSDILSGDKLNIGVSQKVFNLYLKFLWCLGHIAEPPHFPVDRIIQQKLKCNPIKPWTQFTSLHEYMFVINHARDLLGEKYKSLPELELELFNNRNEL